MPIERYGIFSPVLGIKNDFPSILLKEGYVLTDLPDTKDVLFHQGRIEAAKKRLKAWDQALPDPVLHDTEYRKKDNSKYEILCTKRDIAYRDDANDRLVYITPKYNTGKIRVENGSAIIYGGLEVDNCDDAVVQWVDGSAGDVTPSRQTTTPKDGTAFVRLTVAGTAGVELLAYHDRAAIDLTAYDSIGFWIRSSVATSSGDFQFLLDNTAACASPLETLNIPALSANVWTWVNIAFATPASLGAVVSIGIYQAVDKGACTIDIDQVVAGDWADQLKAGDFITIGTTYTTDDTWYEVSSVDSDTKITLTAVYAGSTASQQAYLARVTYSGTNNDYWQSVVLNDKWIATNRGKNKIQSWAGSGQAANQSASTVKARYITSYEGYLIAGFIIDGSGNSFPQTYQWPSLADETDWSGGDAGESQIPESSFITGFGPGTVEGYKLLTTSGSYYRLSLVSGDEVFKRDIVTQDIGVPSPYSMINFDRGVFAFCSDNTFRKLTISSWEIISNNAEQILRELNFAYKQNIQVVFNVEFGLIMWLIPNKNSSGLLNQILTYDVKSGVWGTIDVTGYCFGTATPETSVTWDTLPYATWQTWSWESWDTFVSTANFILTRVSDVDGYVHTLFASETDNGSEYTRSFVVGSDLQAQRGIGNLKRLLKIEAFFESEVTSPRAISCQVKADREAVWQDTQDGQEQSIVNTANDYTMVTFYFESIKLARHFLFRLFGENAFKFIGMIIYFDSSYGYR